MRLVFGEEEEFEKWIEQRTSPEKYDVILTQENEVILVPTKATRTLNIGYFKFPDWSKALEETEALESAGYVVIKVKRAEWDTAKPVGVQFVEE